MWPLKHFDDSHWIWTALGQYVCILILASICISHSCWHIGHYYANLCNEHIHGWFQILKLFEFQKVAFYLYPWALADGLADHITVIYFCLELQILTWPNPEKILNCPACVVAKAPPFARSINQMFYSANIPSQARLSGAAATSVFNSKIEETVPWHQQAIGYAGIYGGKAKSKRCLQMFLKGSNWISWMDRQREIVSKRRGTMVKSSCTRVGLDPRDWQTIIVAWSWWTEWKWCGKYGVKINRLFFTQGIVGQQIYLKQCSKPYWQPMKGTKQWKTASKWRRLCHWACQLILYMLKPCEVNVGDATQKWIAIIKTSEHKSSCK